MYCKTIVMCYPTNGSCVISHVCYAEHIKANNRRDKMKTATKYEIRAYTGNDYSKSLSSKLRDRKQATKLVKRLKKYGIEAFAAPMKIAV